MKKTIIIYLIIYVILIGYKRISLIGWSFFPIWYSLMGLDKLPTGQPIDEFAHNNAGLFFIIGIIWLPTCLFYGLKFEKWIVLKINSK